MVAAFAVTLFVTDNVPLVDTYYLARGLLMMLPLGRNVTTVLDVVDVIIVVFVDCTSERHAPFNLYKS